MKTNNIPRVPTKHEQEELARDLAERTAVYLAGEEELQEARSMVAEACIAVFDNYITTSPGYAGKVMVVVWQASLTYYELYSWKSDGSLTRQRQSSDLFDLFG